MGKSVGQSVALDCAQAGMEFPLLDRQVSVSDERPCGERPTTTLLIIAENAKPWCVANEPLRDRKAHTIF